MKKRVILNKKKRLHKHNWICDCPDWPVRKYGEDCNFCGRKANIIGDYRKRIN